MIVNVVFSWKISLFNTLQDFCKTSYIHGVPELNDKPKRGARIDRNHHEKNQKKHLSHAV